MSDTADWRTWRTDDVEWLDKILHWPEIPVYEPVTIAPCYKQSPKWLDDAIDATLRWLDELYPIPTDRRWQVDGGYDSPSADFYGIDWLDVIHDFVGEESPDF